MQIWPDLDQTRRCLLWRKWRRRMRISDFSDTATATHTSNYVVIISITNWSSIQPSEWMRKEGEVSYNNVTKQCLRHLLLVSMQCCYLISFGETQSLCCEGGIGHFISQSQFPLWELNCFSNVFVGKELNMISINRH